MGLSESRSLSNAVHLFSSSVSLFDLKVCFFVPTVVSLTPARAEAVKVGRCANLAAYFSLARPHLDGFEHDGTVWCGRDDDQRGARFRARFNRATTLYSAGPRTRTMMQSCASAAKLRSGGPILPVGTKAKGHAGIPPPRTVIGASSQADGRDRNCGGCLQRPPFIVPDAKQRRLVQRPPAQVATGRSEACAPRPRSWAFDYRERS